MLVSRVLWARHEGEWYAKKTCFLCGRRSGIVWITETTEDSPVLRCSQFSPDCDAEKRTLALNKDVLVGEYARFRTVSITAVGSDGERERRASVVLKILPFYILRLRAADCFLSLSHSRLEKTVIGSYFPWTLRFAICSPRLLCSPIPLPRCRPAADEDV